MHVEFLILMQPTTAGRVLIDRFARCLSNRRRHAQFQRMRQSLGYIYRNPGRSTWMMKYFQDGRPIRKSTGTDDEKAAQAALNAATTDAGRGIPTEAKVGKLTFKDAATGAQMITKRRALASLNHTKARKKNSLTHLPRQKVKAIKAHRNDLLQQSRPNRKAQPAVNHRARLSTGC